MFVLLISLLYEFDILWLKKCIINSMTECTNSLYPNAGHTK